MPISIEASLIFACDRAARIGDTLPVPPASATRFAQLHWSTEPVEFVGGPEDIDAGLVGVCQTEAFSAPVILVIFRGTVGPPSAPDPGLNEFEQAQRFLDDWLNNFEINLAPGAAWPGRVHKGFADAFDTLWLGKGMAALVDELASSNPAAPIWLTGFSKGGALAHMTAYQLQAKYPGRVNVLTFAAPRQGDSDYATGYAERLPQAVRYECGYDLVPHGPPAGEFACLPVSINPIIDVLRALNSDYRSSGQFRFLPAGAGTTWQADSSSLTLDRAQDIAARVGDLRLDDFANIHSIDLNRGYALALCPGL